MALVAELAGVEIGDGYPVRIIGAINVSPESFFKGSVRTDPEELLALAEKMRKEGADIIDIGAMSTAPYLKTQITMEEEARRLSMAIKRVKESVSIPVSADTTRSLPAEVSIKAGADIINDVHGLKGDAKMAKLVAEYGVGLILVAHEGKLCIGNPVERVKGALKESLDLARKAGIEEERIVVDPAIGFHRTMPWPWYVCDGYILKHLHLLRAIGRPLCLAVSRKSFIGKILSIDDPEDRLFGSLSASAIAAFNGAHAIRTHDVPATLQAVRLAEFIRHVRVRGQPS